MAADSVGSPTKVTHVVCTYFRRYSGRYATQGTLDVPYEHDRAVPFLEVIRRLTEKLDRGERPGLSTDGFNYDCLLMVYSLYGPLPHLYLSKGDPHATER